MSKHSSDFGAPTVGDRPPNEWLQDPQQRKLMHAIRDSEIKNLANWKDASDIMRPITLQMVLNNPHFQAASNESDDVAKAITEELGKIIVKRNVSKKEWEIHTSVNKSGKEFPIPAVYEYTGGSELESQSAEPHQVMIMEKIPGLDLASFYGEEDEDTPPHVYEQCRELIQALRDNGVYYNDITSYNFILSSTTDRVFIIDFGHATYKEEEASYFIQEYLDGINGWNPDFR